MTTKIFLSEFNSKKSVNTSEGLNVYFKGNRKLLPLNDVANTISQYEQYVEERDSCDKIRLTCQVNPICTNALFNKITEIVRNEGSNIVEFLNYESQTIPGTVGKNSSFLWDKEKAIQDMQPSSQNFIYHCGADIFNNHLIRSNTFKAVCKGSGDNFNTINDTMRNIDGNQLSEVIVYPPNAGIRDNNKKVEMHLYEYDDILSYNEALNTRLKDKHNGWFGFENTSKIKTYSIFGTVGVNSKELPIERPIMYMNSGDFIDMYPSRDLYSFVPKYNQYRKRIEKNWNYCITYPSSSTTNGFESIFEIYDGTNALIAYDYDEDTRSDNGSSQIVIYSITKHGLAEGDFVNLYKRKNGTRNVVKILDNAQIANIVNDYVFTVFNGGVKIDESDNKQYVLSYKKVVNDIECDYYVRIFSKLPNFKYASGDTSNEYELYKDKLIETYQEHKYEFENHISKLAFAKNVYSDEIGQVVFTDDIVISNLKDNLGRPLSTLYFTVIKNNKGYKQWYGFNNVNVVIEDPEVEYSHCFGPITCGLEMSEETVKETSLNNVRTLKYGDGFEIKKINDRSGTAIAINEIWYETDKHFYGDLCYYDNYNAIERVIQPFMHRFNTAQRECVNSSHASDFEKYYYDEIKYDDYDSHGFEIDGTNKKEGCNDKKEGYFYKPHYEIPIKTFGKLKTAMPDFLTLLSMSKNSNNILTIKTMQRHFLTIGDKAMLFNMDKNKYYVLVVTSCVDEKVVKGKIYDEDGKLSTSFEDVDKNHYKIFKMDNLDIPSYAKVLKDGTCRFIWRDIINNGMTEEDDTIEKYPFTNGAFYINKRIDIYVRRQDPYGFWGLYDKTDPEGVDVDIESEDNYVKENQIVC